MRKPALLYVGHSYHRLTASNTFFLDILRQEYEVTILWDESWQPGKRAPRAKQINEHHPDVVLFYQLVPERRELRKISCRRLFLVPMHDYVIDQPVGVWAGTRPSGLRVINFCRASHLMFANLGFESLSVQYWPPAHRTTPRANQSAVRPFFWIRHHAIGWQVLKQILGPQRPERVVLRVAVDPRETVDLPDDEDTREYRIQIVSGWLDRAEYLALLQGCNLFMAPRPFEGIGISSLEAMAMGIAVAAPDAPALNEYIFHNRNGYLYHLDAPQPLDLTSLPTVGQQALCDVIAGHDKWLGDSKRILEFMARTSASGPSVRWRISGWWDRQRTRLRVE